MIKQRTIKRIPIGEDQETIVVRLESMSCDGTGLKSTIIRNSLMRQIADTPEITDCESVPFEVLTISYTGDAWVAEMKAVIQKPRPNL
jgi:hypothetical protein